MIPKKSTEIIVAGLDTVIEKNIEVLNADGKTILLDVLFSRNAFFNATEPAKAFGKKVNDYLKTTQTQEIIQAVLEDLNETDRFSKNRFATVTRDLTYDDLVIIKKGGVNPKEQGTWLHPELAVHFAQWLSPKFYVKCNRIVSDILNLELNKQHETLKLSDFLNQIPSQWRKTFPDEFFAEVMRLWQGNYDWSRSDGTPPFVGNIINKYVYDYLDETIVDKAKQIQAECEQQAFIHQFIEDKYGKDVLKSHINVIINFMKASLDKDMFIGFYNNLVRSKSKQIQLYFKNQIH